MTVWNTYWNSASLCMLCLMSNEAINLVVHLWSAAKHAMHLKIFKSSLRWVSKRPIQALIIAWIKHNFNFFFVRRVLKYFKCMIGHTAASGYWSIQFCKRCVCINKLGCQINKFKTIFDMDRSKAVLWREWHFKPSKLSRTSHIKFIQLRLKASSVWYIEFSWKHAHCVIINNWNWNGPWWWSSGQHTCLLLRRSKFESCWLLQFFL